MLVRPSILAGRCRFIISALLLLSSAGGLLRATTLRPLNLEELTRKAGDIVVGRCVAVERDGDREARLPVTKVTIRVDRKLKGRSGRTLTFRMVSSADGSSSDPDGLGVPRFHPGEKLILFLYPAGRSGLTSPVGLGQGKFLRVVGKDGRERAVNEFGNRPLFRDLSPEAEKRIHAHGKQERGENGAIRASDLVEMVEELAQ